MKKNIFFILISGTFLFSACKKEEFQKPEEAASETPVFRVKGTIGEHAIDMTAGVDGAYQETTVITINGIEFLSGKMIKGSSVFSLAVSSGEIGIPPTFSEIMTPNLSFAYDEQNWYTVNHQNLPNSQQIESIVYSLDGMEIGSNLSILSSGFHTICADVEFNDGTTRTVCNKVLLGYKDLAGYKIKFNPQQGTGATNLWLESSSTPIAGVKWYVNGELASEEQQMSLSPGAGVIAVKAVTTFTNGIVRTHEVLVDTDGQGRYMLDMETYKTAVEQVYFNDFRVQMSFQNDADVYASHASTDIPGSLSVNSISLFKELPNGNKIYKVTGAIKGNAKSLLSGNLVHSQLEVIFAIESPY
ncbi:hypothetical protein H9Y05_09445 [Crocinitomicaceae bacterium CZZ-1]|uniref:Uncharacterized protein n=1 Tax=Taishania pollutisoli TaxID=2766479 RepID=A0A8J6PPW8_9FLAO|nr:hypothetical protein [Taishania pollutisoli]MBC9812693.1 hypothetical protein [Taishania pollutisoli]